MCITIRCRRAPFPARGAPPRPGRALLMTPSDDTTTATAAPLFDVREFARTARGSHRSELDLSRAREGTAACRTPPASSGSCATSNARRCSACATCWSRRRTRTPASPRSSPPGRSSGSGSPTRSTTCSRPRASPSRIRTPDARASRSPSGPNVAGRSGAPSPAGFAGPQLVAAHVTAGLVDEWVVSAAYRRLSSAASSLQPVVDLVRLAQGAPHPVPLRGGRAPPRRVARARNASTRRELTRSAVADRRARVAGRRPQLLRDASCSATADGRAEAGRIAELVAALPGIGAGVGVHPELRGWFRDRS